MIRNSLSLTVACLAVSFASSAFANGNVTIGKSLDTMNKCTQDAVACADVVVLPQPEVAGQLSDDILQRAPWVSRAFRLLEIDRANLQKIEELAAQPRIGRSYYQAIATAVKANVDENAQKIANYRDREPNILKAYGELVQRLAQATENLSGAEKALKTYEVLRAEGQVIRSLYALLRPDYRETYLTSLTDRSYGVRVEDAEKTSEGGKYGFIRQIPTGSRGYTELLPISCGVYSVDFDPALIELLLGDASKKPVEVKCVEVSFFLGRSYHAVDRATRTVTSRYTTGSHRCGDFSSRKCNHTNAASSQETLAAAVKLANETR